jgi:hypothetical protein
MAMTTKKPATGKAPPRKAAKTAGANTGMSRPMLKFGSGVP